MDIYLFICLFIGWLVSYDLREHVFDMLTKGFSWIELLTELMSGWFSSHNEKKEEGQTPKCFVNECQLYDVMAQPYMDCLYHYRYPCMVLELTG